jgi:hypothetical protein
MRSTASAEVAAGRNVSATREMTPAASARSVTAATTMAAPATATVAAPATTTVAAPATAAMRLRERGRGADQYRQQNAGRQKNAPTLGTHDCHLRLPVAPLHGHLEPIK